MNKISVIIIIALIIIGSAWILNEQNKPKYGYSEFKLNNESLRYDDVTTKNLDVRNICISKGFYDVSTYMPYSNSIIFYCKNKDGRLTLFEIESDEENEIFYIGSEAWIPTEKGGEKLSDFVNVLTDKQEKKE